jgi:predicted metal-dependent peptidase
MSSVSERLMKARCRLITVEPWYGTMASLMKWKRDDVNTKTMGVRMISGGEVEAIYNQPFCETLSTEAMMAIVKHEIEHVVRMHIVRSGTDRTPITWNVAADAVVNGKERHPRVDDLPKGVVYMPDDVKEEITTEEMYDYLAKNQIKINVGCPNCGGGGGGKNQRDGDGDGDGDGQSGDGGGNSGGDGCPMCSGKDQQNSGKGNKQIKGNWTDDHGVWKSSTVSKDEARQVVKDMTDQATAKNCGNAPGHLQDAIKQLDKPIHNWKHEFRQIMGHKAGGKRKTFARRSRRHNHFGIPGHSSHASIPLLVWVDTSGSMSRKDLEMVFTEIEAMSQRFKVRVGQFDHGIQDEPRKYHRGDWKKIKILGRGGTCFHAPIEHMIENKNAGAVNIILTDGYAPFPAEPPFFVLWAIVNKDVEPPWGRTVRITKD